MGQDLPAFAKAYQASFVAQVAMFPSMMQPGVQEYIDIYKDEALAWKMAGAGGGGYLALVVTDAKAFVESHPEAMELKIRRE